MRYPRVVDGRVVEVASLPDGITPADAFHPQVAATFGVPDDQAQPGWLADGSGYTPPPIDLELLRAVAIAAIDRARDQRLAVGAPWAGLRIALDDGSRADLTAMAATAIAAAAGSLPWPPAYALGWIGVDNTRLPLPSPAEGLALAAAAGDWYARIVQHARDLKDVVLAAPDPAALDALDLQAGWPGVAPGQPDA